jgi:hypothetical protein
MAFVLVPFQADVLNHIKTVLAPYYSELEVEPYRRYFEPEHVEHMKRAYGTGQDLHSLVAKLRANATYRDVELDEQAEHAPGCRPAAATAR